ncbi:hypothetical protein BGX27_002631 [Mortierella sp. AM989]|nr:hypothetical protein BGX27_002631 [Mortierella sp. AM989]
MYLSSLSKIKSHKDIAVSIRKYCIRQTEFLDSTQGRTYIRSLEAKNRTKTNTKLIQEIDLDLSQRETISQQDSQLTPGQKDYVQAGKKHPREPSDNKDADPLREIYTDVTTSISPKVMKTYAPTTFPKKGAIQEQAPKIRRQIKIVHY